MGHNVGKAADIATQKGMATKKTEERSVDKVIADIRSNRASKLHVPATDVDVLLADYDKTLAEIKHANKVISEYHQRNDAETEKVALEAKQEHDVIMREITGH